MIGKLCDFGGEINFEWKIKNFLPLADEALPPDESPKFTFCGVPWVIWIGFNRFEDMDLDSLAEDGFESFSDDDFNAIAEDGTDRWINLYIRPKSIITPMAVEYSFHLKTVEGKEDTYAKFKNTLIVSDQRISGWKCLNFIARSNLVERQHELLPSGVLTLVCTMKKCGTNYIADIPNMKALQDYKELYMKKAYCDVIIRVKGQEFPAHKTILNARSPVLCSTFEIDMKEKATGMVDIIDCDPSTFSDFLCFLYCGKVENLSVANVFPLFTIADKYAVVDLRSHCLKFIRNNLTTDIFCDAYTLALLHSEEEFIKTCVSYFVKNIKKIIVTEKWKLFLTENPEESNELLITALVPNKAKDQNQGIQEYL